MSAPPPGSQQRLFSSSGGEKPRVELYQQSHNFDFALIFPNCSYFKHIAAMILYLDIIQHCNYNYKCTS